eukprot:TRINITY_DN34495_c0_g1_i1.p1 TRINITY_DN34495_c0_g1~~TRINITY_DN34495_c0_g1_i1.p1  ORF type:complete len:275 (+),score=45.22 TRINITY_DN34495_c0_g1_i1:74-898(+)
MREQSSGSYHVSLQECNISVRVSTEAEVLRQEVVRYGLDPCAAREEQSEVMPLVSESRRAHSMYKGGWTGGSLWMGAKVLADVLSEEPERVRGKRVLELGSGCGLVGLIAASLGASEVTLTDEVTYLASHNVASHVKEHPELSSRLHTQKLTWGDDASRSSLNPPYDVIIGSEIMYHREDHERLASTIMAISRPGTSVVLASQAWCVQTSNELLARLAACDFAVRDISAEPVVSSILIKHGYDETEESYDDIHVIWLQRLGDHQRDCVDLEGLD